VPFAVEERTSSRLSLNSNKTSVRPPLGEDGQRRREGSGLSFRTHKRSGKGEVVVVEDEERERGGESVGDHGPFTSVCRFCDTFDVSPRRAAGNGELF